MQTSITTFLALLLGKVRRFCLHLFGQKYIQKKLSERTGECSRCGVCCRLPFKCVFLKEKDGVMGCSVYSVRPPNCRIFPIDQQDIKERDRVSNGVPCGHKFS